MRKLSWETVTQIRQSHPSVPLGRLAREHGITRAAIRKIVKGETYKEEKVPGMKRCPRCNITKPHSRYWRQGTGIKSRCIECLKHERRSI